MKEWQWKALCKEAPYNHELNGNPGPRDPKSGALATQPPSGFQNQVAASVWLNPIRCAVVGYATLHTVFEVSSSAEQAPML